MASDSRIIYKSKDGKGTKEFDVLDFIASITGHIPNKNEQMLRYYGFYSNVCKGRRKKRGMSESDYVIEGVLSASMHGLNLKLC